MSSSKAKFGLRDTDYAYRTTGSVLAPQGNGNPYQDVSSGIHGPLVESGASGLIKITVDIAVPATTIGSTIDWTDDGVYSTSPSTQLRIFDYYASIEPTRELHSRSNFFLQDVHMFFGTSLTGAAGISGTTTVCTFSLLAAPSTNLAWQASGVTLGVNTGRVLGTMQDVTGGVSRILGGQNYGEDYFYLTGSVSGASPANLGAGRIRLVLLGFEF